MNNFGSWSIELQIIFRQIDSNEMWKNEIVKSMGNLNLMQMLQMVRERAMMEYQNDGL